MKNISGTIDWDFEKDTAVIKKPLSKKIKKDNSLPLNIDKEFVILRNLIIKLQTLYLNNPNKYLYDVIINLSIAKKDLENLKDDHEK